MSSYPFTEFHDAILERLIVEELKLANRHLPRHRKSLSELLREEDPHVLCMDGTFHYFRRSELQLLAKHTPEDLWDALKLPIIIEIGDVISRDVAGVIRDKIAAQVVAKILNIPYSGHGPLILYRPQIAELRSKLETATQYAFIAPSEV